MDINGILALIASLEPTGWTKFEVEQEGFHLRLERNGAMGSIAAPTTLAPVQPAVAAPAAIAPETEDAQAPAEHMGKNIKAPLVGIFHPLENAVKAGDKLKQGDVVCMIEAMKLMNEITMPEDGEITFIVTQDGDTVEYDQVIAKYK